MRLARSLRDPPMSNPRIRKDSPNPLWTVVIALGCLFAALAALLAFT